ncbi:MAG: hypothetical protein QOI12_2486 [Alphaproteobacteria bacterium]|nr:hypothetical protein [Alphaproteobacteria bacterium]
MTAASHSRRNGLARALAAALALAGAAVLPGCSSYTLVDALPAAIGGLPEGAPERPATPAPYPAVHDIPPRRADVPLSDAERKRLREELILTRDRTVRESVTPETTASTPPAGGARNP